MPSPLELEKILKQRSSLGKVKERRETGASTGSATIGAFPFTRPIRSREISDFTRQLATMSGARLPMTRALQILAQQQKNLRWQAIVRELLQGIIHGRSLSESLARHDKLFTPFYVNLVKVGEVTGNLPEMLKQLATYLEKMNELKRKLLTAMTYPAVIILVASGAIAFLLFGIMPTFSDLFREFDAQMPAPTRLLLSIAGFLSDHFFLLLLFMTGVIVGARAYAQTTQGRWMVDALKIKLPLVGSVVRKIILARFARTLGTLLQSGVSLLEAMNITAGSVGNLIFQKQVREMMESTARGEAIEKAISASPLFPPLVVQMIAVGEETAELGGMLIKTAEYYEVEVDAAIEALTSIIEPVIIVVLGLILGSTMIAIYLQIFDLMNVIQ